MEGALSKRRITREGLVAAGISVVALLKERNMIKAITAHKRLALATVAVALGAAIIALAVAFASPTKPGLSDPLPPMTLTYEVYGPSIGVGTRSIPRFKEIRRLEYRGENDWTETVIASPTVDLGRYGTGSNVGSYITVKGNTETYYDAMVGTTDTTSLDADTIHLPFDALGHAYTPAGTAPIVGMDAGVGVDIDARVSVSGTPMQNARGIKYTKDDREIVMYEGDGFVLPVKSGIFTLKSVDIRP